MPLHTPSRPLVRHACALVLVALVGACIPMRQRTIPATNPATGQAPAGEMRRRHSDERLQGDCAAQRDWYCFDEFFRLEAADANQVVLRYRVVGKDAAQARAAQSYVGRMTLVTEDGRKVTGRLAERFEVQALPTLRYGDDGYVKTGRREYLPQADGRVIAQDETTIGTVTRSLPRVIGTNYVVFEGAGLVAPTSSKVTIAFPKGLLGGGEQWVFDFAGRTARNAVLATDEPAPRARAATRR